MSMEIEPIVGNWYAHLDKGQRFMVTAVDDYGETVEMQHFDGDVEEASLTDWYQLDLEIIEEPDAWSGALDIAEVDDFGTEITDTDGEAWADGLAEFRQPNRENLKHEASQFEVSVEAELEEEAVEEK